jgi:hypothetical protein
MGNNSGQIDFSPTLAEHLRQPAPELLFHYTGQAGLLGIVSTASLWATNISYVNDSTEFNLPLKLMQERLSDAAGRAKYEASFFSHRDPRRAGHNEVLADRANALLAVARRIQGTSICATCFCEDGDLLSQWRGYTSRGYGYSIGFKAAVLRQRSNSSGFFLGRCLYDPELQAKIMDEVLEYLLRSSAPDDEKGRISELLNVLKYVAFFKDQSFTEESEWRLVSIEPVILKKTLFQPGKSMIIPYTSVDIGVADDSAIDCVYVGPCPHMELCKSSVSRILVQQNVIPPRVHASKIPFRDW